MKNYLLLASVLSVFTFPAQADLTQLIPESTIDVLAKETSGISAKRNLDTITLYHRTRASLQYRQAAEHVLKRLNEYGYDTAEIIEYPADGTTMFGTQKSRPAWEVEFAELWELDAQGKRVTRHGSWEAMPLSVAQDALSGKGQGLLVDIGAGTTDDDYADTKPWVNWVRWVLSLMHLIRNPPGGKRMTAWCAGVTWGPSPKQKVLDSWCLWVLQDNCNSGWLREKASSLMPRFVPARSRASMRWSRQF